MTTSNPGRFDPATAPSNTTLDEPEQLAAQWARIRGRLQHEVGEVVYRTWLRNMTFGGLEGDEVTISLPTAFQRDWVRTNYADRLGELWRAENAAVRRVDLTAARTEVPDLACIPAPTPATATVRLTGRVADISAPLDTKFAFASFIVGKPNEFAYACARRVAERPSSPGFNPLFLYGDVGLGKTHLMHAIGLELTRDNGAAHVAYLSAEKFMNSFISAIRSNKTIEFKDQLRGVDVLMIDDIQFLVNKDATQEEFFHTFNALIDAGRQIVVSSDKPPSELSGIEDRLRTRLGCGIVADLHATTFELRVAILDAKAAQAGVEVPPKVVQYLAHKVTTNVRELEGCLNRLVAHSSMFGTPVTLDNTQELLRDILKAHDRPIAIEEIQKRVAEQWGIRLTDMTSARRSRNVARPRQVAMYLAKQLTERSLPEIGRMFGNRDHTTVMHAVSRITELMAADADFREQVELMQGLLKR